MILLDIVLGVVVLASVVSAALNGLTKELLRIASLVVGLLVAMWGYGVLAGYLAQWISNARIASAVAFALLFIGCQIAGVLLAHMLSGIWSIAGLGSLDRLLGAAFGALRGLLVAGVLLLALVAFQPFGHTAELVAGSRIAPIVLNLARTAAAVAPNALRDAFHDGLERVRDHLEGDPSKASVGRFGRTISVPGAKPDHQAFRLSI
jgi:membrane protein required for colicin V production